MNRVSVQICVAFFVAMTMRAAVPVIKLDDLERRIRNGADTTYVVNLWATWCKPCVEELPWFEKVHRVGNSTRPVKVVLVSLDTPNDLAKVERFVSTKGLRADVVLLHEPKPHRWIDRIDSTWSGAIPVTLLVQHDTNRRAFFERSFTYNELVSTINAFLKELP